MDRAYWDVRQKGRLLDRKQGRKALCPVRVGEEAVDFLIAEIKFVIAIHGHSLGC